MITRLSICLNECKKYWNELINQIMKSFQTFYEFGNILFLEIIIFRLHHY